MLIKAVSLEPVTIFIGFFCICIYDYKVLVDDDDNQVRSIGDNPQKQPSENTNEAQIQPED